MGIHIDFIDRLKCVNDLNKQLQDTRYLLLSHDNRDIAYIGEIPFKLDFLLITLASKSGIDLTNFSEEGSIESMCHYFKKVFPGKEVNND